MDMFVCYEYGAGVALAVSTVWLMLEFFRKS